MKYWAFFAAKCAAAYAALWLVWRAMNRLIPEPEVFLYTRLPRFPNDLPWTAALLAFWLLALALATAIVFDQRRRCRVCLRRLRMPVESGNWSMATIFSPPRMKSICPFGHGTLDVPEVHASGQTPTEWRTHGDIWRELEQLDKPRK